MTDVDLLYLTNDDLEEVFEFSPHQKSLVLQKLQGLYPTLIEDTFDVWNMGESGSGPFPAMILFWDENNLCDFVK